MKSFAAVKLDDSELVTTPDTQKYQSNVFENVIKPHEFDQAEFEAWVLVAVSRYLQQNFSSVEQVAAHYSVRYQTALNWWEGRNCANGYAMARTFMSQPGAVGWFLNEWAQR